MRGVGIMIGTVVAIVLLVSVVLSVLSHRKSPPGLTNGQLTPCPESPNCVCSEYPDTPAYAPALKYEHEVDKAWSQAREILLEDGATVVQEQGDYIAATYTSTVFRFVDDLELRLDREGQEIHIRSASRVGHSDLGVNRKRVERLREQLQRVSSAKD